MRDPPLLFLLKVNLAVPYRRLGDIGVRARKSYRLSTTEAKPPQSAETTPAFKTISTYYSGSAINGARRPTKIISFIDYSA